MDKRVDTLSVNDWARGGMFQPPRLRIKDKLDPNPGGLSSTEQFFNVCFCAVSFRFRRFVIRMMRRDPYLGFVMTLGATPSALFIFHPGLWDR